MDARHLALLRELDDRGSVTAVAEATHRTPSAVSQQLRVAQRELGVRLVEPHGRGVRLTDAGRVLARAAVDVEVALARAESALAEHRSRPQGRVEVVALPSAATFLLPEAIGRLATEGIEVRLDDVDVSESDFARLARDADVVIGHSLLAEVPAGAEALHCTILAREPIDLAVPSGHRLAGRREVRPADLVGEDWIAVPDGYPFLTVVEAVQAATGEPARLVQRVRDNRLVEALVSAGHGVALLPRWSTPEQPGFRLVPLEGVPARRWIVAMSRPDRAERAVVRRLVAELTTARG